MMQTDLLTGKSIFLFKNGFLYSFPVAMCENNYTVYSTENFIEREPTKKIYNRTLDGSEKTDECTSSDCDAYLS